jgi:hypothetical protein
MLSLIRSGPKTLIIETDSLINIKDYLINKVHAIESNFNTAFDNSREDYVIIFLVKKIKDIIHITDAEALFFASCTVEELLCDFINDGMGKYITNTRMAPRIILMRLFGDKEKVLEGITKDYTAEIGDFDSILNNSNDKGTILAFVEKPLNKNISLSDIYEKALFISEPYLGLIRNLRKQGLKYLNMGLNNEDWFDLEIRIYDTFSAYDLHYKRLLMILENLELGIILGESWGKDSPRFLMTVGVYRIRFFTFYKPEYIKKILLGLEHLEDGQRIIDYDLYYNRRKIDWLDVREENYRVRHLLSKKYREEIFSKLSYEETEKVLTLEQEILKTR